MFGVRYEPVYGPVSLDWEAVYEAKLAMPSKLAQHLFGEAHHPYLRSVENSCEITTATEPRGGSGSSLDTDDVVATVKGARLAVEYCRAEMREAVVYMELGRVKKRWTTKERWVALFGRCCCLLVVVVKVVAVAVVVLLSLLPQTSPRSRVRVRGSFASHGGVAQSGKRCGTRTRMQR